MLLASIVGVMFAFWLYQKLKNKGALVAVVSFLIALVPVGYAVNTALAKKKAPAETVAENCGPEGSKKLEKHGVKWHSFAPGLAESLQKEGKTVFVDFTAAWCLTCQTNAKTVFGSSEVVDYVNNRSDLELIYADWTEEDDDITVALESFERSGVPLYLVYKPGEKVKVLPQILTPEIFLEAVK